MHDQKPVLDLSDLTVENIEVVRADSLDAAANGHGMPELGASCGCFLGCWFSCFMPDDSGDE